MSKEKEISEMRSLFLANKGFTVLFSLAPCDSAEQNNPVNCFARGMVRRGVDLINTCSLFLFDFDAKRKSRTEKEKHEWLNGSSHQGLCPRTPNTVKQFRIGFGISIRAHQLETLKRGDILIA